MISSFFLTGVYKKLQAASKKKGCVSIAEWAHAVSNHLYWCAASSAGNGDQVVAKWTSILNHLVNVHTGHGEVFPECEHEELTDREWIKKGEQTVFRAVLEIILVGLRGN